MAQERRKTQEEAQFGVHPNSVDANLHRLDPEVQELYRQNRARFDGDQAALRRWARAGFVSDGTTDDEPPAADVGEEEYVAA